MPVNAIEVVLFMGQYPVLDYFDSVNFDAEYSDILGRTQNQSLHFLFFHYSRHHHALKVIPNISLSVIKNKKILKSSRNWMNYWVLLKTPEKKKN